MVEIFRKIYAYFSIVDRGIGIKKNEDIMAVDLTIEVEKEVLSKIADGDMFTAFNITKSLRNRNVFAKHDEVKKIVHDMFESGKMTSDYERTSTTVGANSTKVFVYHMQGEDPSNNQNLEV